jgi:hypothetical protein
MEESWVYACAYYGFLLGTLQKKNSLTQRIFCMEQFVVVCKCLLVGGWAFPVATKDGTQFFSVLDSIPTGKYTM